MIDNDSCLSGRPDSGRLQIIRQMKARQLDELVEKRQILYREPVLRQFFLELTLRCNSRCFHCGSRCDYDSPDGLSVEEYLDVLRDVKEHFDIRTIQLCITGGEPLLYQDFFPLLREARAMGFHWGMTSNGTLITREVAEQLREAGMGTISVSIDGLEETHDRLRGLPGGYRLAMRGIQNLIDVGGFHAVQVTTVVNHGNIGELDALYDIFRDIDIDSWRVIGLEPIGRAKDHPDLMLTPDDHRRIFSFIREKREERMPVTYGCSHFLGLDYEKEVRKYYFKCNAGIHTASVMANGDVGACLDIERRPETIQGNVRERPFSEIWKNEFRIFREPLYERFGKGNSVSPGVEPDGTAALPGSVPEVNCPGCPEREWCRGGAFHSWDYDRNVQQICFKGILF